HSNSNSNAPALAPAAIHVAEQAVSESPVSPSATLEPPVETSALPVLQDADANQAESAVSSEETLAEDPTHQDHPLPAVTTRKSGRSSKPSIWLKDYVATVKSTKDTPYTISNFITYDHLSENYKSFLGSFSEPTEPKSFKEAC
ncbi:hypothetical protein A4A49_59612, partial [Nicotiana attenuata]